jgi:DNA primase
MGKISPVSIKYNILAKISLTSIADKPDVIGAIFGQTEGLLGSELELRELQKTGKIGRIEVKLRNFNGKSDGEIIIPSSMGKSETAIIGAAIETIDRVGPCNAKIIVDQIQDVRITKREFILKRAEELLRHLVETLPDSAEFTNKVTQSVRTGEIMEYGKDKLPAGPMIDDAEEILVVEGRADVVNLLKYGIRNAIALNGVSSGDTLVNIMRKKIVILFVDGDRGGDLVIKKLGSIAEIDFVVKAPDGKEVEELTMKEIQKTLRGKHSWEQYTTEIDPSVLIKGSKSVSTRSTTTTTTRQSRYSKSTRDNRTSRDTRDRAPQRPRSDNFVAKNKETLKELSDDLMGTRGAYVLDDGLNILGKVPVKELTETLDEISDPVFAIIMDGSIDSNLAIAIDKKRIKQVITKSDKNSSIRSNLILFKDL